MDHRLLDRLASRARALGAGEFCDCEPLVSYPDGTQEGDSITHLRCWRPRMLIIVTFAGERVHPARVAFGELLNRFPNVDPAYLRSRVANRFQVDEAEM